MPGVTEQEIAQAKQMNLYQYMQLCEPDNFRPEGPGQFRHKGHSSLTFAEDGSWTYFKTKATGRTALNYLIAVEGVSFVEAVREINRIQSGVSPSFQPVKASPPPAEKKPTKKFSLPRPDKNNYAATAYLRKRCIHPNVLTVCKQKKILYQTSFKDHPNCVFVGRDGNGEAKGGSLRGCSQIQFRRDIPGSKKIYPFYIEAAADADTVEVYEAPIDAMSGASLKIMQHTGNWRGVHYLALGGTDYAALDALIVTAISTVAARILVIKQRNIEPAQHTLSVMTCSVSSYYILSNEWQNTLLLTKKHLQWSFVRVGRSKSIVNLKSKKKSLRERNGDLKN